MKFNYIILLLLFFVVANGKLIMLIRQAEKINEGVSVLSPEGQARADCLVNIFGNNGTYISPQKIYAQRQNVKKHSFRARETVAPLSKALGLPVDTSYTNENIDNLTKRISDSNEEVVLISWSRDKIKKIPENFGLRDIPDWKIDSFDEIWMIYDNNEMTKNNFKNHVKTNKVYSGTNNFKMEIVNQNINQCIDENIDKSNVSSTMNDSSNGSSKSIQSLPFFKIFLFNLIILVFTTIY